MMEAYYRALAWQLSVFANRLPSFLDSTERMHVQACVASLQGMLRTQLTQLSLHDPRHPGM